MFLQKSQNGYKVGLIFGERLSQLFFGNMSISVTVFIDDFDHSTLSKNQ